MSLFFKKPTKDISKCKFDYDAYWKDIEDGMPYKQRMKKMENLDYYVEVAGGKPKYLFEMI